MAWLTEQYERLREGAANGHVPPVFRCGYAVLAYRGVAAWMQVTLLRTPYSSVPEVGTASTNVPPFVHDELLRFMGQMVLAVTGGYR